MTSRALPLLLCLAFAAAPLRASDQPLALGDLVHRITSSHPELDFYAQEIAAAKAGARTAGRAANPELSVELGQKRVKSAGGGLAGEGAAWSVSVSQTIEWPGRLALRKAIANGDVALAELGLARFRAALEARVRTLAYGLRAAQTRAGAVREVADRFSALRETFLAREPSGITPLLETRVIEAAELALQHRATEAELEVQASLMELNQLRGAPIDAPLALTVPNLRFQDVPSTGALLAAAAENNFDFRLRRAELEQQGFAVRLAQHERRPSWQVSPFYSQEKADGRETVVGLGLSVPLPAPGRTRSSTEIAAARQRQAETAVLLAQRELEREVLTTAQRFAAKVAEIRRWVPDTTGRFREAAELADRHYRLGAVPVATYVELQTSYLDAVESLLATEREALGAGVQLQLLTGLELKLVDFTP